MLFWKRPADVTLVVGLGNPGEAYARSRHNIGFMCVDDLARRHGIRLTKKQAGARTGLGEVAGRRVLLAQPQTFVNRSGEAVGRLAKRYRVSPDRLIVIHDELDLPSGKIRIRQGGSSAGHKGIASIAGHLGTADFLRVRVGIGRPENPGEEDIVAYVLGDLTPAEEQVFDKVIPQVADAVECLLAEGPAAAMNRFN